MSSIRESHSHVRMTSLTYEWFNNHNWVLMLSVKESYVRESNSHVRMTCLTYGWTDSGITCLRQNSHVRMSESYVRMTHSHARESHIRLYIQLSALRLGGLVCVFSVCILTFALIHLLFLFHQFMLERVISTCSTTPKQRSIATIQSHEHCG